MTDRDKTNAMIAMMRHAIAQPMPDYHWIADHAPFLLGHLAAALDENERLRAERDEALGNGVLSQTVCDIYNDRAQLRSDVADLTLRLSIATATTVADRKRIAELEAGLREALNNWEDVAHFDHDTIIRLRDLLPSEET